MIKFLILFYFFFWKFYLNALFYVSGQAKYDPMRASSYSPFHYQKNPKAKQEYLNIQSNDEKYFLWSILASLHPVQRRNNLIRVSQYQEYEHELSMSGIQYSVEKKIIGIFEHQNSIGIDVYGYEDKNNLPVTYYRHEFAIYHCWWKISLRIGERLEQTRIETI